jgi:pyrroline-5-carboxylate reductase
MLVLVGCGKMGGALLEGWLERGLAAADVTVIEPDAATAAHWRDGRGLGIADGADDLPAGLEPEVVVFAVKPQVMDATAPAFRRFAATGTVYLSIAAGKTIAGFEGHLGDGAAIVRSMPNTPAAVRRGITVACANARVSDGQRRRCQDLLEAVGEVAWVEDEALLDAVTAVSGSGPAYVFLLAECLAHAAVEAGLPDDLAGRLARVTVSGSGELLRQSPDPPAVLRRNVTSPGGTTAEALAVLMAPDAWPRLVDEAVAAAARRSRELAG